MTGDAGNEADSPPAAGDTGAALPRVSPITFPKADPAVGKPDETQPQAVRDAYRECTFALGPEMGWLLDALRLQRQIVEQSYPSKFRSHRYAAALLYWSRIYNTAVELLRLTSWAAYTTAPPLVRASLDWLAAEHAVVGSEFSEFEAWLRAAYEPDREHSATNVGMGQYMAGQQIAMRKELAAIYRAAADLSRPHFGASALVVAPESDRRKLAVHWGDQSFHFGWAQLLFGWQVAIQQQQLRFAVGRRLFAVEREERERFQALGRQSDTLLGARDRCRAEWVSEGGRQRLLIHNFRRQPSGAPRRILL